MDLQHCLDPALTNVVNNTRGQMNKVHISLNASDVKKSQEFYESFLEKQAYKMRPGYGNFDLNNPLLKLVMQEG